MKTHTLGKAESPSNPLSSPPGCGSLRVYHDAQKVAFKMHSNNGHIAGNGSHTMKEQITNGDNTSCNSTEQKFSMRDTKAQRISMWTVNSSTQAYSGPEDNSTDPPETLTETSTLNFVDGHTLEEQGENHSLYGVTMVYLKEFVLIDDDDDGDMSLREKTVNNLTVMDGKAADLVCGRLVNTSSVLGCHRKGESSPSEDPLPEHKTSRQSQHCCYCVIL
ncbi:paralemmin-2 [Hippocampus zosterae]|uniref:paralemmin-2 n=1 Tax=Hippocampus zosterae TaxID=109293 RepID=UPI00223D66C3|nr:paralemmin-2 [Hippocampus zosterae]